LCFIVIRGLFGPAQETSKDALISRAAASVVKVVAHHHWYLTCGSGVVVSSNGYILTAAHVVEDADYVVIITSEGNSYSGSVKAIHAWTDLALVYTEAVGLRPVIFCRCLELKDGDEVFVLGYPGCGEEIRIVSGIVGKTGVNIALGVVWYDASIEPGFSGGPVINNAGELVAVHFERPVAEGGGRGVSAEIAAAFIPQEIPFIVSLGHSAVLVRWVEVSERVWPGDVLQPDPVHSGRYRRAVEAHSPVSGVVVDWEKVEEGKALLAFAGIVPVKVTAEGGPIQPGDLLVVSSTPGYAMRWDPAFNLSQSFVGKSLGALERGVGIVPTLLIQQTLGKEVDEW